MRLGDIVPAQLQDAPDYSESAPLFLSSLYYLSGGASYYNPNQAAQANPIPAAPSGGSSMTADPATCLQIQCGAISQAQAGADLLQACSEAGLVGAKTCGDPACAPYLAAMQANGICPPGASPAPTPSPTPMPSATTATLPSLVDTARLIAPVRNVTPLGMQQRMPSIVNPAPAMMMQPCTNTFAQWVDQNKVVAAIGLGLLAWAMLGRGRE